MREISKGGRRLSCRLTQAGRPGTDTDEKTGRGREGDTCRNVRTRSAGQQGDTGQRPCSEDIVCGDYCCPGACYRLLGR